MTRKRPRPPNPDRFPRVEPREEAPRRPWTAEEEREAIEMIREVLVG